MFTLLWVNTQGTIVIAIFPKDKLYKQSLIRPNYKQIKYLKLRLQYLTINIGAVKTFFFYFVLC